MSNLHVRLPILFDAHNHLQDSRIADNLNAINNRSRAAGIRFCSTCDTCETDWSRLAMLAEITTRNAGRLFGIEHNA